MRGFTELRFFLSDGALRLYCCDTCHAVVHVSRLSQHDLWHAERIVTR
jgi:hypothetical protein